VRPTHRCGIRTEDRTMIRKYLQRLLQQKDNALITRLSKELAIERRERSRVEDELDNRLGLDVLLRSRKEVKDARRQGEIESLKEGIFFTQMVIKWGMYEGEKLVQATKQLQALTEELKRYEERN
jgi:hypothetical protein